eukprot:gb/GECG01008265.1/.p1 GENE.gb/GECG01008265.1/~~gb/GECG01008265.1/.p1  ORF type:complete len:336 (+),score=54.97 gb/GECG01008265.1/:1-1008(+)
MAETTTIKITGPGSDKFGEQPAVKLHTGALMPMFGLGTWKSDPKDVRDAVVAAVRAGYRHIDLAAAYGNQQAVGEGLKTLFENGEVKREDLFITSKLWLSHCWPEHYKEMLNQTLSDLGLSYLDMYLIHFPYFLKKDSSMPPETSDCMGYTRENYGALWKKLEEEVDQGRLQHIGTSNMSIPKMKNLLSDCRIKPANNQVELHPYLQQKELVKFCQDNGIAVTAYSPLGSPDRPDFCIKEDHKPLMENEVVGEVAKKHNCSNAQALIRWAIARKTCVIPKSVTPSRIQQNIESLHVKLDDEDMKKLGEIDEHIRYVKGDIFIPEGKHWKDLWDEN